ncbi:unnamed protein product [Medioppia subpectinata]|uniref:Intradiol ring-cleavage dioxygenases domain-containing protein n=1 Tax=Medioppia subpectinata TaxID=1979941 RepID=A0A7R9KTK1_9ACAR|nr:unnamed protein product [Medioppia subpectinata]CAG2109562.1 unnamed protein product [Medioppia subpectinata]
MLQTSLASDYCAKFGRHLLQHQCELTPEAIEGPYYLPLDLVRKDIREDRQGVPLTLKILLTNARTCEPLVNVSFDIWHCDALGVYSSYVNAIPNSDYHEPRTDNTTFLRGRQYTNQNGIIRFKTIYPGWYGGRATHIHMQSHYGDRTIHTGQLYFHDTINNIMARLLPYNMSDMPRMKNEEDSEFMENKGADTIINYIKPVDIKRIHKGLKGTIHIGLNPKAKSTFAYYGRTSK